MDKVCSTALTTDVHVFESEYGENILHAPLLGKAFFIDDAARAVVEKLKSGNADSVLPEEAAVLDRLQHLGLIGEQRIAEPTTEPIAEFKPTEATLIFTETCNLGCSYCYASSSPVKSAPMPEQIMRAAVELACANAAETDRRLADFRYIGGGEPTVEWALLEKTTEYIQSVAQRLGVQHFIRLITNGTLLTADRIDWISRNIQFVTLSFEILPELQVARSYANGGSTHERLMGVVRALCSKGVQFHLRTTISSEGAGRLEEMVRYVHENCGATSIRFEPLSNIGRSLQSRLQKPVQAQFVSSFKAAYRLGRALGIDVTCKMFTNVTRKSNRFCDAEFSVTPAGDVTGCHRYSRADHSGFSTFRIGHFDGERFVFDHEAINALRAIDVHQFPECTNCVARWNCAGGCLSARMGPTGVSTRGPLCDLTRELLRFSIQEKMEECHHVK